MIDPHPTSTPYRTPQPPAPSLAPATGARMIAPGVVVIAWALAALLIDGVPVMLVLALLGALLAVVGTGRPAA